jgi:hypothetical protein
MIMAQQNGDRHPTMTELQDTLDQMRREQAELAVEIQAAEAESNSLPGDVRKILGGPIEEPINMHRATGSPHR